ncbi:hypothetical protein N9N67_00315 [Bacteriovoracaceae bacterium]|nr:hypothetical protein [Bacteriovoracaceae bacterium]
MKVENKKFKIEEIAFFLIIFNLLFFYFFFKSFPNGNTRLALFNLIFIPLVIRASGIITKDLKLTNPIEKPKFLLNEDIFEEDKNNLNIAGIGFKYNSKDKENQIEHVKGLIHELRLARKVIPIFLIILIFPLISNFISQNDINSVILTSAVVLPLIVTFYAFPVWNILIFNLYYILIYTCILSSSNNLFSYLIVFSIILLFFIGLSLIQKLKFSQNFNLSFELNIVHSFKKILPSFIIFLTLFLLIDKIVENKDQSFFDYLIKAFPEHKKSEISLSNDPDINKDLLSEESIKLLRSMELKGMKNINIKLGSLNSTLKRNQNRMNELQKKIRSNQNIDSGSIKQELANLKMDMDLSSNAINQLSHDLQIKPDTVFKNFKSVTKYKVQKEKLKSMQSKLKKKQRNLRNIVKQIQEASLAKKFLKSESKNEKNNSNPSLMKNSKDIHENTNKQFNKIVRELQKEKEIKDTNKISSTKDIGNTEKEKDRNDTRAREDTRNNPPKPINSQQKISILDRILLKIKKMLLKIANSIPYIFALIAFFYFFQKFKQKKYLDEDKIKISPELKKEILKDLNAIPNTDSFVSEAKQKYQVFFSSIQKIYYENKLAPPPLILPTKNSAIDIKVLREISLSLGDIYTKIEFGKILDFNSKDQKNFRHQFHQFKIYIRRN